VNSGRSTSEDWLCLEDGAHAADFNMAVDEALLEAIPVLGRPLLRFYAWSEPAATFGYSQRYAEMARLTPLRPLVRRPTGGGLVPHDRDFTYTFVVPPLYEWYDLRARDSYRRVHDWLRRAFDDMGWSTELATVSRSGAGQCFVGAEQFDVLWSGAKIAGAAQRRTRSGLLIQGSVQPPSNGPARAAWQAAMKRVAEQDWSVQWTRWEMSDEALTRAQQLAATKYSQAGHNQNR
jgi:lipoate-protein ligase A